jgi:hypothetical protein
MKRSIFLLLMVLAVDDASCRVPENLLGTDIFPDEMSVVISQKTGKDTSRDVAVTLPTKALNLSYGAECFTVCCQPLYQFGDLVRLDEQLPAGGAGDVVVPEVADGAIRRPVVRINNFYKEIVQKGPLTYAECNPLAILVRALFWQNPGTSGLADLRVAKSCTVSDATGQDDLMATMDCWADVVAVAMNLYQIRKAYAGAKAIDRVNVLYKAFSKQLPPHPIMITALQRFEANVKKPNMVQLLYDCITWSEANALGKDFPLRVLMGAVYALAGHDKGLIAAFYKALQQKMAVMMPVLTADAVWPVVTERIERFAMGTIDPAIDSPASRACALLKKEAGSFAPVAYARASIDGKTFADCFETMMRNIVLALLINHDESFRLGIASTKVDEFLTAYGNMAAQATAGAHDAWAQLVNKIPGAVYVREGGYELQATLVNMFFMLNYLFDLGIVDFGTGFIGRIIPAAGDNALICALLPKLNEALAAKFGLEKTAKPVIQVMDIDTASDLRETDITCVIHARSIKLLAEISCYGHGEIITEGEQAQHIETGEFAFLERSIAQLVNDVNIGSNLVLLTARLSRATVNPFIVACKGQSGLLRMLYAVATRRYENDLPEYYQWLANGVREDVWINEAIEVVQAAVRGNDVAVYGDDNLNIAMLSLCNLLVLAGHYIPEITVIAENSSKNTNATIVEKTFELFEGLDRIEKCTKSALDAAKQASDKVIFEHLKNFAESVDGALVAW